MSPAVWVAVGTRPEAIKMAPVALGLRQAGLTVAVCTTGQHPAATAEALAALDVPIDVALPPVPAGTPLAGILGQIARGLASALVADPPRLVLVHGDTTGALGAALGAGYARVPVGHVESGLRTGDPLAPFPEELNRRAIDHLSALWLAPTAHARDQLVREGCAPEAIHVTGNPVVDALEAMRARVCDQPLDTFPTLRQHERLRGAPGPRPLAVVTAHRREHQGPELLGICDAVRQLATRGVTVVWPVHPNPEVDGPVRRALHDVAGVVLTDALPYPAFVRLLLAADLVLTDSGGVQEEAACLGRPTLVLRARTERPEVLDTGVVRVIGTAPADVVDAALAWLADPPRARPGVAPLGDGRAGVRIGGVVAAWLAERP